jgi:type I restriction enzyme, S subunit
MRGRFSAYSKYQTTGVEWLGELPVGWQLYEGKRLFSNRRESSLPEDEQLAASQQYGVVPQALMMRMNDAKVMLALKGTSSFRHVEAGDFVISLRSFEGGVEHSAYSGCVSPAYTVLAARESIAREYYRYLLKSGPFVAALQSTTDSLRDGKSITFGQFGAIRLPIPSFEEQTQIAKFLDYQTAKIDALFEKQQQLIALLKEKRQAVISHAVTKGLNPDAPMRDSGVEWLGEVPAHWAVVRLKHTCEIQSGMPKGKPASATTVDMPMLRVANVQDGWLNLDDVHQIPVERSQVARYLLRSGDVLMNEGGDRDKLGRGTIWRGEVPNCIHQNHVFAIRPLSIESEWLDAVTRADYAKFHFYQVAKQSTNLASISSSNIKETPLVVPPADERKAILDHIDLMTEKTSTTIELADRQNVLLQERRTALISAAVTGKIDVRGWTSPDSEVEAEVA